MFVEIASDGVSDMRTISLRIQETEKLIQVQSGMESQTSTQRNRMARNGAHTTRLVPMTVRNV